jgi:DNA-binding protein YbaB
MFDKAKKLWELKNKATQLQKELKALRLEETALEGKIKVVVTGEQKVESIFIDESLMTPAEKDLVERQLKITLTAALSKAQQIVADKMKDLTGGDLSGLLG